MGESEQGLDRWIPKIYIFSLNPVECHGQFNTTDSIARFAVKSDGAQPAVTSGQGTQPLNKLFSWSSVCRLSVQRRQMMSCGVLQSTELEVPLTDEPHLVPVVGQNEKRVARLAGVRHAEHSVEPVSRETVFKWSGLRCTGRVEFLDAHEEVRMKGDHVLRLSRSANGTLHQVPQV